ncbi:hypothetical protein SAMN04488544_0253 [Microlunatus sagamiharensis]|uniref:Tat (Twin-arginine translocation) pathway signal sequence n=1 Tax=Microlunatus sagamiharensis TaxID=546874 RepID=A0A1H2LIX0_9ACTN|nr:hypothetical protein [Microlunatus sagamiharensis]SDU80764.1 hypothetical protein SAMN04488544_0253 [Microlunatus sagamiharensis]
MTDIVPTAVDQAALQRRGFLRGGALLAAAAGGAVAATVAGPAPAQAAEGDVVTASFGFTPLRYLDTRTADGRALIVGSSKSAFDSKHRLRKNAWLDVAVFPADEPGIDVIAAYVNVGSRASTAKGTLLVTDPEGGKSSAWTMHYGKGAEVNNSAIVAVSVDESGTFWTVRIYAGSVTHVVLDLTGVSASVTVDAGEERAAGRATARGARARVTRAAQSLGR